MQSLSFRSLVVAQGWFLQALATATHTSEEGIKGKLPQWTQGVLTGGRQFWDNFVEAFGERRIIFIKEDCF